MMRPRQFDETVAKKFRLARAPTLFSRYSDLPPIAISRLHYDGAEKERTQSVPAEEAFAFQIAMRPMAVGDIWLHGKHNVLQPAGAGDTFLYDLSARPAAILSPPYDFVRIYIPLRTINELAHERGLRGIGGLKSTMVQGVSDPILHGLGMALMPALENPGEVPTLFLDQIGLAIHSHTLHRYAGITAAGRSGLADWQFKRVCAYIEEHLHGDPTIADLARECGLSQSHFASAFRRTAGMPPYQWLTKRRVERAKLLLQGGDLSLSDIARCSGFSDLSHLSRVFSRFEGHSPGRWRRLLLDIH